MMFTSRRSNEHFTIRTDFCRPMHVFYAISSDILCSDVLQQFSHTFCSFSYLLYHKLRRSRHCDSIHLTVVKTCQRQHRLTQRLGRCPSSRSDHSTRFILLNYHHAMSKKLSQLGGTFTRGACSDHH